MRPLVCLLLSVGLLTGCSSIHVYELEQRYSENPDDPARAKLEKNIEGFLKVAGLEPAQDHFVLNASFLTIRVPFWAQMTVDDLISYSVCFRGAPPGKPCKRVK